MGINMADRTVEINGEVLQLDLKTSPPEDKYTHGQRRIYEMIYGKSIPDSWERFKCKACDGVGRFDDIPCAACNTKGYALPIAILHEWDHMVRRVERETQLHRQRLMLRAEKEFAARFPLENPTCLAHPNVQNALASMKQPNPIKSSFVQRVCTGFGNWLHMAAWSRKTTTITESCQKKPTSRCEAAVEPSLQSGSFPPVTWPQLITCGIKGASPNTSDESSSQT